MKKIILLFYVLCALVYNINAQQKFDITTYKIGKDYKAEKVNANTMQFTKTNDKTGGYCIITLGKAVAGNGNALEDFKAVWAKAITQNLQAPLPDESAIESEKQKDGRTMVTSAATVKIQEADNAVMLITSTGNINTVSIMIITNSNEFENDITDFGNSLQFAKTKASVTTNPKPVTAGTSPEPITTKNTKPAVTQSTTATDFGEYFIDAPAYFKREIKSNVLFLTEASVDMKIFVLQPMTSSGNLETDINSYYESLFKGWKKYEHYSANSSQRFKGTTYEGVNYMIEFRDIISGEYPNEVIRNAALLLFQLGNRVAVIAGNANHVWGATQYPLYETLQTQYTYIIHNIQFKNYKSTVTPVNICGTKWSAVGSSYANLFGFNTDGTFANGSATSFRVSHSDTHDKVTTTSRGNDGKWSVNGNILTRYYNSTKKTFTDNIRILYEKKYDGAWEEKLGMFSKNETGYGEAIFYRDKN
jgi:hypothetical protein